MLGVLDVVLWSLRKSPGDVVRMYERLSPLMCGITGGSMLNFGYWDCAHGTPALAQGNMCRLVADAAELSAAATGRLTVLDVGSGLCAPAMYWARHYSGMDVFCVNTSYGQLHEAAHLLGRGRAADRNNNNGDDVDRDGDSSGNSYKHGGGDGHGSSGGLSCGSIDPVNASAVALPFAAGSADRVIALESAQHFKPLALFASECRRAISDSGILAVAIPVVTRRLAPVRLGILNFTWASEHYLLGHVRKTIRDGGFKITDEWLVGGSVYAPLADYYEKHRPGIKRSIRTLGYPSYLEGMIATSMRRMRGAADAGVIEYAMFKCRPC